jgi:RNA 3'-terminal phosphate cyclase (ATP)
VREGLNVLTIDGSEGEGGGQVLRSALSLSLVTGTPFRITSIRARRAKSGLLRQHLTSVRAAAQVGAAEVSGAEIGSCELEFRPRGMHAGDYRFSVGSAGSACLVVQTVLPPLLLASGTSTLTVEGGTHNPAAPPWDFFARVFLPLLARCGARVTTTLERHGFYPAGGGRFQVSIEPARKLAGFELLERGAVLARSARALLAHVPREVGERELRTLAGELPDFEDCCEVRELRDSAGPGNALLVEIASEHVTEVFAAFGERGLRAEKVAGRVAREVREYLSADVPVGSHLADQLLLPLAIAGEGRFRTLRLSEHARTNIQVVQRFLPVQINVRPGSGTSEVVEIARAG